MSEKHKFPTITAESQKLQAALDGTDHGNAELTALTAQMKESASVAENLKVQRAAELLLRNLVVAASNVGQQHMDALLGTTQDEIVTLGYRLAGTQPEANKTAGESIADLQDSYLIHDLMVKHDSDPAERVQLVDALMFANQALLATPAERQAITQNASTRYYSDNIAAAHAQFELYE